MTCQVRFAPRHQQHSIDEVVFALTLESPLDASVLELLLGLECFALGEEKTYAHLYRHLGVVTSIGSYPPGLQPVMLQENPRVVGLQLCDILPMEKAKRILFIAASQITLVCRDYSNWTEVFQSVRVEFDAIIKACGGNKVLTAALTYIDRFCQSEAKNALSAEYIFRNNSLYLPNARAGDAKPWHNQCGFWLEKLLVNMTIQRQYVEQNTSEIFVDLRCTDNSVESLEGSFNKMHEQHKKILRGLFSDDILLQIGLSQGDES